MIRLLDFIRATRPGGRVGFAVLMAAAITSQACAAPPELPQDASWYDGKWPQERSPLAPHPGATFGRLENGFRYVILPNAKPKGRVHLSLNVQAGSLMEQGDQLGLAHFLEHMAFNGSRHFPPGALIPFLQRHGMGFGGDVNAHTSFAETVYKLDLSSASREELSQGLLVLRDVADGMQLKPEEVDKERGVILAEKNARDTEKSRLGRYFREVLFGGTRFINDPIGVTEVLQAADSDNLQRFYDAWYRPERMALVVVGEVDPASIRRDLEGAFADLHGRGAPMPVFWWGNIHHQGVHGHIQKTKASGLNVTVTAIHPRRHDADSVEVQRRQLVDGLAREMLQGRLVSRASTADAPFVGARFTLSPAFELFPSATLSASCLGERWRDCLATLEQELRSALDFGFTATEFDEAGRVYRARLDKMVTQRTNRTNKEIAEEIIGSLNADRVFQSEEQTSELYVSLLDTVTKDDVETALRHAWNTGNRQIFASGDANLGPNGEAALVAAWNDSGAVAVAPRSDSLSNTFPYLAEPTQSAAIIADTRRTMPGTALTERTVRLANGVTLRLLQTPFETGRLSLSFQFGRGLAPLSDQDYAVAIATAKTLKETGIGKLSREDERRLLSWRNVSVDEGYSTESFTIGAAGTRENQDLLLTALWTQYLDPTIGADGRLRMLNGVRMGRNDRFNTVDGVSPTEDDRFLYGGARRDADLDEEKAATIGLEAMQAFLARSRNGGPRTLIAVGDFDPDALVARAAVLFSAVTAQSDGVAGGRSPSFPVGQIRNVSVADPLSKASLTLAWRSDLADESEQKTLAVRRLLAAAVNDRLREQVREELGASYSPSGRYRYESGLGGFGMFQMSIKMDRTFLDKVRTTARDVAAKLARDGVAVGTAERLRAPMLAEWTTARAQNRYWLRLIERESVRDLPYATWSANQPDDLRQITDDDLSREARAVFALEAAEIAVVAGAVKEDLR